MFKLLLFAASLAFIHTVYPKLMWTIYCLEVYDYIDMTVRVISNQKSHKERSVIRNICFNLLRCLMNKAFRHYVLLSPITDETWIVKSFYTIIVTILVHIYLPKQKIVRHAEAWSYLFTFYIVGFGLFWMNDLTQAELWSKGQLKQFLIYTIACNWFYLHADFLEDAVFRDLGVIGNGMLIFHWFWPAILIAIIGYAL